MHNRRRNPSGRDLFDTLKAVLAGGVSSIATPALVDAVLPAGSNSGVMGYAATFGASLALGWLTHYITKSRDLALAVVVGGSASMVVRAYQENVGNVHTPSTGMSAYETTPFYLPSVSVPDPSGSGMVAVQPAFTAPQIPTVTAAQASSVGTPGGGQAGRLAAFSRYH